MNILAVDDEKLMLNRLVRSIKEASPDDTVYEFRSGKEALSFAEENRIDIAFLDINMRGMDGLTLAKELNKLFSDINIIFCTGYDEYVAEAFREIRCNGYITKPVDVEQIKEELKHLRLPMKAENTKRVKIQCFGYFSVSCDGSPMVFGSSKTLELFAYIVNACGAVCTNQEIMTYLWDDDGAHDSYFKKIRKDLFDTFEKYGCEDILVKTWGGIAIQTDLVDCDYYKWKKENTGEYEGEFMRQYFWI